MSKYKYRARQLHQVNWQNVQEQSGDGRVVFAVDVAKRGFFATLMKPDRTVLETLKWSHPQQTGALLGQLQWLGVQRLEAVLEPSGTYGDALLGQLSAAGVAVYRLSPKRVHDAAELYDGVPSLHDAKAAYLIGRLHLEGVSQRWAQPSEQRRRLQAELSLLEHYQERAARATNRLEARLARHWPEALEVMSLQSVSLLKLLADYGAPAALAGDATAAGERLRRSGGRWLREEKIAALLEGAGRSVGVACLEAERRLVQVLAAEVLEARAQCRALEKRLAEQVGWDAELARQGAALGKVSAVVLRCALGEAQAYPDAASYLKASGLNLKERSSGKHKGQLKITKRGPGVARRYLYFAALRLIAHEGPARRWYEAKVARDGGLKSKAITALMRKLAKAMWHVGRGEAFEQDKLFGAASVRAA